MNQEQVWNKLAGKWDQYRHKPIQEVIDFLKDKSGKILDLGCGGGRNFVKFEDEREDGRDIEFYGVDFSEKMLKLAKQNAEKLGIKAKFKLGKAEKLDYDDEFFDAGLFISTLHCIEGDKNREKALVELYRVLKLGGEAIISVWNKDEKESLKNIEAKEGFINWQKDGKNYQRYYYFYDKDELLFLLKKVGFEIINTLNESNEKHSKKNIVLIVKK